MRASHKSSSLTVDRVLPYALRSNPFLIEGPSVEIRRAHGTPPLDSAPPPRVVAISDGVFAVLITLLVLDLRPPASPSFMSLRLHWPALLSYAESYLFIALVWTNHRYLMRYATEATPGLLWFNFAHLFSMSLLPLSTAWMALSRLAPQPVAFYALVFFLVNATYIGLIRELLGRHPGCPVPPETYRRMCVRALITLLLFGTAAVIALASPLLALGMCVGCLLVYLKPEPPTGARDRWLKLGSARHPDPSD